MSQPSPRGLFITGTGTEVGKTYVAARIARDLCEAGRRVGVYKPAASGCRRQSGQLISDDALQLFEAAGRPESLDHVCPQRFEAPLAPYLAAEAEGKRLDESLLIEGARYWFDHCEVLLVEGAGGLMSPMGPGMYAADLARELGFPLVIVAANALGTINATLQTLLTAQTLGHLPVAGIVLTHPNDPSGDLSTATNPAQLAARADAPLLATLAWQATRFDRPVDWFELASMRT